MNPAEIQAARRELRMFRDEFAQIARMMERKGKEGSSGFARSMKKGAKTAASSFIQGFFEGVGGKVFDKFFNKEGEKSGRTFSRRFKRSAKAEMQSNGGMAGMMGPLNLKSLAIIGVAALGATAAAQLKSSIQEAIGKEQLVVAFDALSQGGGSAIFEALRQDALRTGVEIGEMASNVRRLMAQGMGADEALKLNKSLLDIGGATGLTTREVTLLGSALSQVKGKGVAQMEELRQQIAEKGVPIFEALRQSLGVGTVAEVFDEVKRGAVSAEQVIAVFRDMQGPFAAFRGGAERMGATMGGLFARMGQEWLDLKRVFADNILPELKPFIEDAITRLKSLKDEAALFGQKVASAVGWAKALMDALSLKELDMLPMLVIQEGVRNIMNLALRMSAALIETFKSDELGDALETAAYRFKDAMLEGIEEIFAAMSDHPQIGEQAALARSAIRLQKIQNRADFFDNDGDENAKSFFQLLRENFANQEDFLGKDPRLEKLLQKIADQRAKNLADRKAEEEAAEAEKAAQQPGDDSGNQTSAPQGGSGDILGGAIASALSMISGGPATVLMTKQLDMQRRVLAETEETTKEIKRFRRDVKNGGAVLG